MANPWSLYGDDPELALMQLRAEIEMASTPALRACLLRYLPSLGRFDEAAEWLQRDIELLRCVHGRATRMRLLQHSGEVNPWLAMLEPADQEAFLHHCDLLLASTGSFDVWLGGGLGDQLEFLARMQSAVARHPQWQDVVLVLPWQSKAALEPLLHRFWHCPPLAYRFETGPARSLQGRPWLSMLPMQALLARGGLWCEPVPVACGCSGAVAPSAQLLCCWRTKVDQEEKLWAHLRSVPFLQLMRLYEQLVPWAEKQGIRLVDISRYRPEEQVTLQRFAPALQLAEPQIGSLEDTAELLLASAAVISVDTALVHLANWFAWPILLLLHQHPDERWRPLLRAGGAEGRILPLRQTACNRWAPVLDQLLTVLPDWEPVRLLSS